MAEVHEEGELGASVDEVWKLISDFGGFIEAMGLPVDLEGEGIGQTRTIKMGAVPTIEKLEERDDANKRLVYSIIQAALPVENYLATMQLSAAGDGRTKIVWTSKFDIAGDTSPEDAVNIMSGIYKAGIGGLQARFGA
jgi:hypothetical protein